MKSLHDARGEYRAAKRRLGRYIRRHDEDKRTKDLSSHGLYLMLRGPDGEDEHYDALFFEFIDKQGTYSEIELKNRRYR